MQVTQIVELSKNRSRVYLEQESAFVLYNGELRKYHISEGAELADEEYQVIMEEILPKRAKLRVMNLLKSREYTTAQLRQKLQQGFYPEAVITQALEYVAGFHYTDDNRYALDYINYNAAGRSRRRIEQDLLRRGIDRECIEQAWQKWEGQGGCQDEQEMIERLLEKKHYDRTQADNKEQQKMYAFLMRKGFSPEQIRKAMEK